MKQSFYPRVVPSTIDTLPITCTFLPDSRQMLCNVVFDERQYTLTTRTSLHDPLAELAFATLAVGNGEKCEFAYFKEEGKALDDELIFKYSDHHIEIELSIITKRPDGGYSETALDAVTCTPIVMLDAMIACLDDVLHQYGYEGYHTASGCHDFPMETYRLLHTIRAQWDNKLHPNPAIGEGANETLPISYDERCFRDIVPSDTYYEYEGNGQITTSEGDVIACRFRLAQQNEYSIIALCASRDEKLSEGEEKSVTSFSGVSLEGWSLHGVGDIIYHPDHETPAGEFFFTLHMDRLSAQRGTEEPCYSLARYRLFSFKIKDSADPMNREAFPEKRIPFSFMYHGHRRSGALVLQRITGETTDYCYRHRLKVETKLEVACLEHERRGDIQPLAHDIVSLLSFSQGSPLQWSWYEFQDADGEAFARYYAKRLPNYDTIGLLFDANTQPDDLRRFLETALTRAGEDRTRYRAVYLALQSYIRARNLSSLHPMPGVELAVAVKQLDGLLAYLLKSPMSVGKTLPFHGESMPLSGENVRRVYQAYCAQSGLTIPADELDLFVRCHDALVETGHLFRKAPGAQEYHTLYHPTPADAYLFLIHILDRVYLSILGYRGKYLAWNDYFQRNAPEYRTIE